MGMDEERFHQDPGIRGRRGLTLIELLAVIVCLAILAAIVAVAVAKAKEKARCAGCVSNLRQLHLATMSYVIANNGELPRAASCESRREDGTWRQCHKGWLDWYSYDSDKRTYWAGPQGLQCIENGTLFEYVGDPRIYVCPTFARPEVCGAANAVRSYGLSAQVSGGNILGAKPPSGKLLYAELAVSRFEGGVQVSGYGIDQDAWADDYVVSSTCRMGGGGAGDVQGHRSMDGMLEARDKNTGSLWSGSNGWEHIGTYHSGAGYGVFVDGHVQRISYDATPLVCDGTSTNW
jgi:prepilin-type N-terminal cleavage/methylation domain-containing protein/prepilin-type processing-associated H-X9-DG protein